MTTARKNQVCLVAPLAVLTQHGEETYEDKAELESRKTRINNFVYLNGSLG